LRKKIRFLKARNNFYKRTNYLLMLVHPWRSEKLFVWIGFYWFCFSVVMFNIF